MSKLLGPAWGSFHFDRRGNRIGSAECFIQQFCIRQAYQAPSKKLKLLGFDSGRFDYSAKGFCINWRPLIVPTCLSSIPFTYSMSNTYDPFIESLVFDTSSLASSSPSDESSSYTEDLELWVCYYRLLKNAQSVDMTNGDRRPMHNSHSTWRQEVQLRTSLLGMTTR